MLSLDTTTRQLYIVMASNPATTAPDWMCTGTDYSAGGLIPVSRHGQLSGSGAFAILAAPASGHYVQLKFFAVHNADTAAITVTIQLNESGTLRNIVKVVLQPGDQLGYGTTQGWYVLDANGAVKSTGTGVPTLPPNGTYADITVSGSGNVWTIGNDVVTYAKMQNVSATSRFLGRITTGPGNTEELTGTQATSLLNAFTTSLAGLVPASGGGTTNFLRADGTWAAPPAGGTPAGGNNEIQYNVGGAFASTAEFKWSTSLHTLLIDNTGVASPGVISTNGSVVVNIAGSTYALSFVGLFCSNQHGLSVSTLGSVIGRYPVYDNSQNFVGYLPIYDNIT